MLKILFLFVFLVLNIHLVYSYDLQTNNSFYNNIKGFLSFVYESKEENELNSAKENGGNLIIEGNNKLDKILEEELIKNNSEAEKYIKEKIRKIELNKIKLEKDIRIKKLIREKQLEIYNRKLKIQKELDSYPLNLDITSNYKYTRIQQKSLSCELSALSDILSSLENSNITEDYLIGLMDKSYYNKLPVEKEGKLIWGNPNKGYVGYIDKLPSGKEAHQRNKTGYGMLEKPISKLVDKFGYNNKIISNKDYSLNYNSSKHLTELLVNINKGNFVQLWGDYCTDPNFEDTKNKNKCKTFSSDRTLEWYYEENGKYIKYRGLAGEHAFYLLGYKGGVQNPTHIIVWDTNTGKHIFPINEWNRKWGKMENKSIIIYKDKEIVGKNHKL